MLQTENNNREVMTQVSYKLQKDYNKLLKKIPQISGNTEDALDYITLGEKKNNRVIIGSALIPAVPLVLGAGELVGGLIALIPGTAEPAKLETIEFFAQATDWGHKTLENAGKNVVSGIYLFALPVAVCAISLSVKLYRDLIEKRRSNAIEAQTVIKLIDDVMADVDDDTLAFAKKFLRRVDLSQNDPKLNLEILKYLAYHRAALKSQKNGKMTEEEVEEIYDNMILFFKLAREKKESSESFRKNRFLSIRISEYDDKMHEKEIFGELPPRK